MAPMIYPVSQPKQGFLSLPGELRNTIYDMVAEDPCGLVVETPKWLIRNRRFYASRMFCQPFTYDPEQSFDREEGQFSMVFPYLLKASGLAFTNRQISSEVRTRFRVLHNRWIILETNRGDYAQQFLTAGLDVWYLGNTDSVKNPFATFRVIFNGIPDRSICRFAIHRKSFGPATVFVSVSHGFNEANVRIVVLSSPMSYDRCPWFFMPLRNLCPNSGFELATSHVGDVISAMTSAKDSLVRLIKFDLSPSWDRIYLEGIWGVMQRTSSRPLQTNDPTDFLTHRACTLLLFSLNVMYRKNPKAVWRTGDAGDGHDRFNAILTLVARLARIERTLGETRIASQWRNYALAFVLPDSECFNWDVQSVADRDCWTHRYLAWVYAEFAEYEPAAHHMLRFLELAAPGFENEEWRVFLENKVGSGIREMYGEGLEGLQKARLEYFSDKNRLDLGV
ncbi:hypothetical protein EJ05DRAFT_16840 [Pseudovirgaria hyperparasitica]|uniref:Uncharacterized protein n=1 Tax=Pseudovirgaria hyperparasitica TaxID=470096 RepID=A0A6A6WKY7_9PEZI|nr:uncharacterized protein EJ05DRAFT_16840 [Pseudovirgaria hyperparasitica]KAF2762832.1 hypothetical protein EJ05DRAFT_16840 [Pseudovirgaria hyperparasitica]